ncbi:Uncharacterised protein [Klebsiella oxytoca]|nr:Uncharacterised protein [Klebsiella oxytoca]
MFQMLFLVFSTHWNLLELSVTNNDRVVFASRYPTYKPFSISRFKIFFSGYHNIGCWIQLHKFPSHLFCQMVWNNKQGFITHPKSLTFHSTCYHLKRFTCSDYMS